MSRKGKANLLIALGALVMGAGILLALEVPDKVFGDDDAPVAEAPAPDPNAAIEAARVARQAKIQALMTSKKVLGVPRKTLNTIAGCESHGDPKAIGGGGLYRGKYQFHRDTWKSVGGKGDPAKAPEWEQDRRAARLYKTSGPSQWPVCGV
jgi:hypothetical protein